MDILLHLLRFLSVSPSTQIPPTCFSSIQTCFHSFIIIKGRQEGRAEVLHGPVVLLQPVEGEDAAGHRGQAQGEETAEGMAVR